MKLLKLFLVVFLQIYPAVPEPSIIIIGAGSAGLAAASRLVRNNFTNITILEAENRIGGRIHSVYFGEAYVDLGAELCHGNKNNVVYEMVKDFNILKHNDGPTTVLHSSRKHISKEFSDELIKVIFSIYRPDGHRDELEGKNLGSYCIRKYNSTIYDKYGKQPEKLEVAKSSMDLLHHIVLDFEGAFSWFEPSALSDYTDCEGDLYQKWNGRGYKTALDILMNKFPDPSQQLPVEQAVLLNKEVVQVFWNESRRSQNRAKVVCSDGSSFSADHVIFTPSIGVLKARHWSMFVPILPRNKREAIKDIGFGGVMKIVMFFKSPWWINEKNFTGFYLIWSEEDKARLLEEFPYGPSKEGRSWLTELYTFYTMPENPNVLIAWLTGDLVPEVERMPKETITHGIKFVLRKFLGHKHNITGPESVIRTSWNSNPHFRGTYSYQTPEARKNKISAERELAEPLLDRDGRPVVQFAGEATHSYFYSTVHGAMETGFREADRIIDLYR